jgi:hypothetical protein
VQVNGAIRRPRRRSQPPLVSMSSTTTGRRRLAGQSAVRKRNETHVVLSLAFHFRLGLSRACEHCKSLCLFWPLKLSRFAAAQAFKMMRLATAPGPARCPSLASRCACWTRKAMSCQSTSRAPSWSNYPCHPLAFRRCGRTTADLSRSTWPRTRDTVSASPSTAATSYLASCLALADWWPSCLVSTTAAHRHSVASHLDADSDRHGARPACLLSNVTRSLLAIRTYVCINYRRHHGGCRCD